MIDFKHNLLISKDINISIKLNVDLLFQISPKKGNI